MTPSPPRPRRHRVGLVTACVAVMAGTTAAASVPDTTVGDRSGRMAASSLDSAADLATCVRGERTRRPRLSYLGGVVRCLHPARVETTSSVRWSTCAETEPAPGERCETGSATIEFSAKRAVGEWRLMSASVARGWPREARAWHLYGEGTAACRHDRHGLAVGDPRAHRSASGRINHVDFLSAWPDRRDGLLAVGVRPVFNNDLPNALDNLAGTIACRPLYAQPLPPSASSVRVAELLDRTGVTTTVSSTRLATKAATTGTPWRALGLEGDRIEFVARTTSTVALSVK